MNNKNQLISSISKIISKDDFSGDRLDCLKENLVIYFGLNNDEIVNIVGLINAVSNNRMNQEFLASILLRVYKNHENIIENASAIKHKVISLFDTVYEHSIYKKEYINKVSES